MSQQRLLYGVAYSPAGDATTQSGDLTIESLSQPWSTIRYVRVQWVDLSGQIRYKVLTSKYFLKMATSSVRPGITSTIGTLSVIAGTTSPGFNGIGEILYAFDLGTLRVAHYEPAHAVVMGHFEELTPHPTRGLVFPLCPRTILQRVEREAQTTAGVRFLAGVEHEFILLTTTSPATAINSADWAVSSKLPSGSTEAKVLQEIARLLEAASIEVQMYHAEAAPGQYEVITGPLTPLQAADAVIYTRETIYNVASKYGLRATFAPRIRSGAFTGAHTHLSVHDIDPQAHNGEPNPYKNASFGHTLPSTERSFLQGILTALPSVLPLTYPTPFSYDRVQDGMWTGGSYVCWGTDHREAPVRLTGSPGGHHFEVRCVDGTANPYHVLAALLGAGTRGIVEKVPLEIGDCRKAVVDMSTEERASMGLEKAVKLPSSVEEARRVMQQSPLMQDLFGEEFIEKYISINESSKQLVQAVRNCMSDVIQVYLRCSRLNRDVSLENIELGGEGRGIIIDWDHSRDLSGCTSSELYRTNGAWQFLSYGHLRNSRKPHTILDDMESFFWVLLYIGCHYLPNTFISYDLEMFEEQRGDAEQRAYFGGLNKLAYLRRSSVNRGFICPPFQRLVRGLREPFKRLNLDLVENPSHSSSKEVSPDQDPTSILSLFDEALMADDWPEADDRLEEDRFPRISAAQQQMMQRLHHRHEHINFFQFAAFIPRSMSVPPDLDLARTDAHEGDRGPGTNSEAGQTEEDKHPVAKESLTKLAPSGQHPDDRQDEVEGSDRESIAGPTLQSTVKLPSGSLKRGAKDERHEAKAAKRSRKKLRSAESMRLQLRETGSGYALRSRGPVAPPPRDDLTGRTPTRSSRRNSTRSPGQQKGSNSRASTR
ncbi:hypothetical protein EIP91_008299 [Steccherinum ochraceum]|uniref:Glutamine synthetase n=1 Tax=Steccherinum ochraceum TaxID=92696 RepID=A0A4R0RD45_9APHY|nr:hypothetical protein EIP91_008299 [Steccherinum ochraceum]